MHEGTLAAQAGSQLFGAAIHELGMRRACIVVAVGVFFSTGLWIMDSAQRCMDLELMIYGLICGTCGLLLALLSFTSLFYNAYILRFVDDVKVTDVESAGATEQAQSERDARVKRRRELLKTNSIMPPLLTVFAGAYLAILRSAKGIIQDVGFMFGKVLLIAGICCWGFLFFSLRFFW
ncbi:unnamed protein product (mitochondrion) [Plasmodiophora brassicae]|uniref:Uncharacterized protein n=1 Tax=Plasmodiophora brassicae TaxID=37360 RepID=A0A0G4IWS4_PLABS|nr:hypothetical protein PBRA_007269 [Plasmodiophora brassicae]SPQ95965.1 unnamed protein product [Plasmodiophora brassicae]